jgi:phasin family protein
MANSQNNNPFMDGFKMFTDGNMFSNNKMMQMFDMNQMMTIQRRNAEMMSAANQSIAENMQALMRRQAEVMQSGAADMFQMVKEIAISPNPEVGMSKTANFTKNSFENAMSNTREMAEMAVKSGMEMFDMMSKRMADNMSECSNVCMSAAKKKAS